MKTKSFKGFTALKISVALILGFFVLQFIIGADVSKLYGYTLTSQKVTVAELFQACILIIKTLVYSFLAVGGALLFIEVLELLSSKIQNMNENKNV